MWCISCGYRQMGTGKTPVHRPCIIRKDELVLKEQPKTYEELVNLLSEQSRRWVRELLDAGIPLSKAVDVCIMFANDIKLFAAEYSRLLEEGKIPEGERLSYDDFSASIASEQTRRQARDIFKDIGLDYEGKKDDK
jgi:hypothetical protein